MNISLQVANEKYYSNNYCFITNIYYVILSIKQSWIQALIQGRK